MDFVTMLKEKHHIALNEQQLKAVEKVGGATLLSACPGSGKTTTLVALLGNMVLNHGIRPENILTLTFSKAAARDMEDRFRNVFGEEPADRMSFSTIHSFCYQVLRTYCSREGKPFPEIIEDERAKVTKTQLLKQLYLSINRNYITDDKLEELSNALSYARNMLLKVDELEQLEVTVDNFAEIYKAYERYKRENNCIDYDDMLLHTYTLLRKETGLLAFYRNRYPYLLVDEAQDTSLLQHKIIQLVAHPRNNIFMVGDINQSIYGFRAAFPKALLEFADTYPGGEVLFMERNYRSTQSIVIPANEFIKQNRERFDTNMFTEKETGVPVKYTAAADRHDQFKYMVDVLRAVKNHSDYAILYRNNNTSIPLADYLDRHSIPFYLRDFKAHFFKHWVTQDILCFLQLAQDPKSLDAYEQVYYKMNAFLSRESLDYIKGTWSEEESVFDVLLGFPSLNSHQAQKILRIRQVLQMVAKSRPARAIELIEEALEYTEYLRRKGKEGSGSGEPPEQILDTLKNIAMHTGTMVEFASRLNRLQDIMARAGKNRGTNAVTLSTIHSSKGLEWNRVYLLDLFDGVFPGSKAIEQLEEGSRALFEEEVRLFYVAVTRAREYLELLSASHSGGIKVKPSRFIARLLEGCRKIGKGEGKRKETRILSGEYRILEGDVSHTIQEGALVHHKKYGLGYVKRIELDDDIMDVDFSDHGSKTLSKKVCLMTGILKAVEEI